MKNKFNWTQQKIKKIISIQAASSNIGKITFLRNNLTTEGEINNNSFTIKSRGHLNLYSDIIDKETQSIAGTIKGSFWTSKSTIDLQGKQYLFKYNSIWCKAWKVFSSKEETLIDYTKLKEGGEIESNTENNMLLLIGLYIANNNYDDDSPYTWILLFILLFWILF